MKKKTKNKVYVGIDIGGTKIAVGLVDQAGKLLAVNKCPTPEPGTGARIFHLVEKLVRELLDEKGLTVSSLRGIGAGVPGIVRPGPPGYSDHAQRRVAALSPGRPSGKIV